MSAPRKVRKEQSVRIRSIQSLTNSIEPTIALHKVTSVMKPIEGLPNLSKTPEGKVDWDKVNKNLENQVNTLFNGLGEQWNSPPT